MRPQAEPKGMRTVTYRNDAGETIPAFAVIQFTGTVIVNGATLWLASQWAGDVPEVFYVNGPFDVEDGEQGIAYSPHVPVWVLYDDADTPVFGEEWGPVSGSFEIGVDGTGFIIMGGQTEGKVLAVKLSGGGCEDRNEKWGLTIGGNPTGGTFQMELNILGNGETMEFNWDDTATEVQTELETHTEIASGDVVVTGGPFPDADMTIEFIGDLANHSFDKPLLDFSTLTGGSGRVVIVQRWTPGHPNDGSVAP